MNGVRWFIRREDDEPRRTPADSPFRQFVVRCLKCDSHRLRVASEYEEETGEVGLLLICTRCGQRERVQSWRAGTGIPHFSFRNFRVSAFTTLAPCDPSMSKNESFNFLSGSTAGRNCLRVLAENDAFNCLRVVGAWRRMAPASKRVGLSSSNDFMEKPCFARSGGCCFALWLVLSAVAWLAAPDHHATPNALSM